MRVSYMEDCIKQILAMMNRHDIDGNMAVELFVGDGGLYSSKLAPYFERFLGYDIDGKKEERFRELIPNGSFVCCDVIDWLTNVTEDDLPGYSLLSIDNPLCLFGHDYCEHFDVLPYLYKLIKKGEEAIIALDFVRAPYNPEKNDRWIARRTEFYGKDGHDVDLSFALKFYRKKLLKYGMETLESKYVLRETDDDMDYFYMILFTVKRYE